MRLTQMLAVLNGEVPDYKYDRLSHYDPSLHRRISKERAIAPEYDAGLSRGEAEARTVSTFLTEGAES